MVLVTTTLLAASVQERPDESKKAQCEDSIAGVAYNQGNMVAVPKNPTTDMILHQQIIHEAVHHGNEHSGPHTEEMTSEINALISICFYAR